MWNTFQKGDKIFVLGKDKLNTVEIIIYKALINSCISHDEFFSVNNVLREYYEMKKEIKNPETSVEYNTYKKWKPIGSFVKNILLTKVQVSRKINKID